MLGLCLCNVAFGVSGMALSAMSVPAHVCSFVMFIFGIALFSPFCLGLITGGSLVLLCSGFLCPVDWVRALTCLVPVHVRCSFGGSSLKSFTYTEISAGANHTVLLRSDGSAVAIGNNTHGQCNIPPLKEGMAYIQISAGISHTVLIRSDGCAVAVGSNR